MPKIRNVVGGDEFSILPRAKGRGRNNFSLEDQCCVRGGGEGVKGAKWLDGTMSEDGGLFAKRKEGFVRVRKKGNCLSKEKRAACSVGERKGLC